jgi:hypothetical protein
MKDMRKAQACVAAMAAGLAFGGIATAAAPDLMSASEGYTYFNRPGASTAEYEADMRRCIGLTVNALPSGGISRKGGIDFRTQSPFGLGGNLMAILVVDAHVHANLQNCMVAANWRVMRLDPVAGAALWKAEPAGLREKLAPWIGAASPPGEELRSYANDAARRGTTIFKIASPLGQRGATRS